MDRWSALEFVANILGDSPLSDNTAFLLEHRRVRWERVAEMASHHLVTPWLYWRIQERGIAPFVDADFLAYLEGVYTLNALRNREKNDLLGYLISLMRDSGIESVVMKGSASQVENLYRDQGIRMFSDVDILIHREDLDRAVRLLFREGFSYWERYSRPPTFNALVEHHYPCLVHRHRAPCRVELHVEVLKVAYKSLLPPEQVFERARSWEWEGLVVNTPCLEHRLLHNFVHNQLSDRDFEKKRISLRQMLEFGRLMQQPGGETAAAVVYQNLPESYQTIWRCYADIHDHLFEGRSVTSTAEAWQFLLRARRHVTHPYLQIVKHVVATQAASIGSFIKQPGTHVRKLSDPLWYANRWRHLVGQWHDRR